LKILALSFLLASCFLNAQNTELKLNFLSKLKSSPFWFVSNQNGFNPNSNFANLSHLSESKNLKSYRHKFGVGINYNHENFFFEIEKAFFEIKNKKLAIKLGRFHSSADSLKTSSGSLVESSNAFPIPKILVSNPNFSQFKFLNHTFSVRGEFAHGWIDKGSYVKAPYLHQKSLTIKKEIYKNSKIEFGLNHMVLWAGETRQHGRLPSNLNDFLRVILALNGGKNSINQEQENSLGNHLGAWSFKYEKIYKDKILKLYMEHPFEDESGARWILNEFDGLYGLNLNLQKSRYFSNFTYEYINTMDQSGPKGASDSTYGWDNYYNHYIYQSGWTNRGRVIGNPLFTIGSNKSRYSDGKYIINNRLKAHHFGFKGAVYKKINYKILFTYSENFGTYPDKDYFKSKNKEYRFDNGLVQRSGLIELNSKNLFDRVDVSLVYGFDNGELLNKTDSFMLRINHKFKF